MGKILLLRDPHEVMGGHLIRPEGHSSHMPKREPLFRASRSGLVDIKGHKIEHKKSPHSRIIRSSSTTVVRTFADWHFYPTMGRGGHSPGGRGARVSVPILSRGTAVGSSSSSPAGGGGGNIAFFVDWRTTTGTDLNACGDGGKCNGGFTGTGDGKLTVVPTTGLGAPAGMVNCLQVNLTSSILGDAARMVQMTGQWAIPAVSSSIWYRMYYRSDWTDGLSVGNPHFVQHGGLVPGLEWVFRAPGGDAGRFESQANSIETNFFASYSGVPGNGYPNNNFAAGGYGHGTLTPSGVFFRIEWQFLRNATNTVQLIVRIYNNAGTLTWTNAEMWGDLNTQLSVANPSFPLTDLGGIDNPTNQLGTLQLGNNGPGSQPAGNNYSYFAGFAVSLFDWCGVYSVATG